MKALLSRKALLLALAPFVGLASDAAYADDDAETWAVASQQTDGQALFERLRFSSEMTEVLRMPCPQRMRVLDDLSRRSNRLSGEARVAAAVQAHLGECGRRNGDLQRMAAENYPPAKLELRALNRLSTYVGAADFRGPIPLASAVELLPRSTASRVNEIASCTQTDLKVDAPPTMQRFETAKVGELPVAQAFVYWGAAVLGANGLCQGAAQRLTVAYHVNWPAIVAAWQRMTASVVNGALSERDLQAFVAALSKADAQLQVAREEAERVARAAAAQRAQQEAESKKKAEQEERELASYMSKAQSAQAIYLRAGKYERENQPERAKRLYEYLTENHRQSEYAVKANDRLLQMKSEMERSTRAPGPSRSDDGRRAALDSLMVEQMERNAQFQRDREQAERDRQQREREEAEFIQRRNEQIRRQNEQWEEEERRRRLLQP